MAFRRNDGRMIVSLRIDGKWRKRTTKATSLEQARRIEKELQREIDAKELAGTSQGLLTIPLADAVDPWIRKRGAMGYLNIESERTHLVTHVLPRLADMTLADVKAMHAIDVVEHLRATDLAPRTVRNIYATTFRMWQDYVDRELLLSNPWAKARSYLPQIYDGDPEWRDQSLFTHEEVRVLIGDGRIPEDRRVVNAILALAGLRISDVAALRFRHYAPNHGPLGRLTVALGVNGRTKTKQTILVPVHPALGTILAWWRYEAWPQRFGRLPVPDDLIVPGPPGPMWTDKTFRDRFQRDLPRVGLRLDAGTKKKRSPHGLRASFLTLAVEDGAVYEIIDRVLHPAPPRARTAGPMYLRPGWEAACREVEKLDIEAPPGCELGAAAREIVASRENQKESSGSGGGTRTPDTADMSRML